MHSGRAAMTDDLARIRRGVRTYINEDGFRSSKELHTRDGFYSRGIIRSRITYPSANGTNINHRGRAGGPTRALGSRVPHWPPRPAAPAHGQHANHLALFPMTQAGNMSDNNLGLLSGANVRVPKGAGGRASGPGDTRLAGSRPTCPTLYASRYATPSRQPGLHAHVDEVHARL